MLTSLQKPNINEMEFFSPLCQLSHFIWAVVQSEARTSLNFFFYYYDYYFGRFLNGIWPLRQLYISFSLSRFGHLKLIP